MTARQELIPFRSDAGPDSDRRTGLPLELEKVFRDKALDYLLYKSLPLTQESLLTAAEVVASAALLPLNSNRLPAPESVPDLVETLLKLKPKDLSDLINQGLAARDELAEKGGQALKQLRQTVGADGRKLFHDLAIPPADVLAAAGQLREWDTTPLPLAVQRLVELDQTRPVVMTIAAVGVIAEAAGVEPDSSTEVIEGLRKLISQMKIGQMAKAGRGQAAAMIEELVDPDSRDPIFPLSPTLPQLESLSKSVLGENPNEKSQTAAELIMKMMPQLPPAAAEQVAAVIKELSGQTAQRLTVWSKTSAARNRKPDDPKYWQEMATVFDSLPIGGQTMTDIPFAMTPEEALKIIDQGLTALHAWRHPVVIEGKAVPSRSMVEVALQQLANHRPNQEQIRQKFKSAKFAWENYQLILKRTPRELETLSAWLSGRREKLSQALAQPGHEQLEEIAETILAGGRWDFDVTGLSRDTQLLTLTGQKAAATKQIGYFQGTIKRQNLLRMALEPAYPDDDTLDPQIRRRGEIYRILEARIPQLQEELRKNSSALKRASEAALQPLATDILGGGLPRVTEAFVRREIQRIQNMKTQMETHPDRTLPEEFDGRRLGHWKPSNLRKLADYIKKSQNNRPKYKKPGLRNKLPGLARRLEVWADKNGRKVDDTVCREFFLFEIDEKLKRLRELKRRKQQEAELKTDLELAQQYLDSETDSQRLAVMDKIRDKLTRPTLAERYQVLSPAALAAVRAGRKEAIEQYQQARKFADEHLISGTRNLYMNFTRPDLMGPELERVGDTDAVKGTPKKIKKTDGTVQTKFVGGSKKWRLFLDEIKKMAAGPENMFIPFHQLSQGESISLGIFRQAVLHRLAEAEAILHLEEEIEKRRVISQQLRRLKAENDVIKLAESIAYGQSRLDSLTGKLAGADQELVAELERLGLAIDPELLGL